MSFVEDSEGHVKVAWVSKFNVSVEPIVYMLQSRWNIGIHPSEDHASPWTTVAMVTTGTSSLSPFTFIWGLESLRYGHHEDVGLRSWCGVHSDWYRNVFVYSCFNCFLQSHRIILFIPPSLHSQRILAVGMLMSGSSLLEETHVTWVTDAIKWFPVPLTVEQRHKVCNISLPHNSQFASNDETSQLWRWMLDSVSTSSVCCLAV